MKGDLININPINPEVGAEFKFQPANRINEFPPYPFAKLAKEVSVTEKETGRKVLNFGPGSPDFKPSELYLEKVSNFYKEGKAYMYPGYEPIPEFSDAITVWYKKRFGVELDPKTNKVFALPGAKYGITLLPLALLNPGDEVLIPCPGYPAYDVPARMAGGNPVKYNLPEKNNFRISVEELEKKVTDKTKFIWVNFPSNPTGRIADLKELTQIVEFCRNKRPPLFIIYDNAYSEITFNKVAPSILQIPKAEEITVEIGSFSKSNSFAGYRIGWMAGNKDIINAFGKLASQLDSGVAVPLQRLGADALNNHDEKWHTEMIASYKKRRDIIAKKLRALDLKFELPDGALYIWAKIPDKYKDAEEFCTKLLKKKQVLFAPGSVFGESEENKRYVRVSFCINIDKIDEYLSDDPENWDV